MGKKTGECIRQARTAAKMTQAQLAKAVGLSPIVIGKAERGELDLTQAALKSIAKATGVTQVSLLNAEKATAAEKTVKQTAKGKAVYPMMLTSQEKKVIRLFRKANEDQISDVLRILSGEKTEVEQLVDAMLGDKWKRKLKK